MLDLSVSAGLASHCCPSQSMSTLDSSRYWDSPKSDRKKEHMSRNHIDLHREHHSSANDPTLQSSREDKSVLSNSRPHPRAELKEGKHSNHTHNHVSSSSRKRKTDAEKDDDDVWAEHKSSSGRIYYYNKRLDKSQWEKPTKGTIKKLKSESHSSKSSSSSSSQSSSHSKSHSSTSKHHHHHHSSSSSSNTRHSSSKSRDDKTSSSSSNTDSIQQHKPVLTPSTTAAAVMTSPSTTPISTRLSNMVSPLPHPSASPLTPSVLPQYSGTPENPLVNSQVPGTAPYTYSGGGTDPNGLNTSVQMGWSGGVVNTPNSGMHPLQHTMIQYTQGYPLQHSMTPPFIMPQGAHTPSGVPLPQSAPATPPSMGVYPSRRLIYQDHPPSCSSKALQKPMSLLGVRSKMDYATQDFPDPSTLKPLTQPPNNELYSRVLAELVWWTPSLDQCSKQMDQTHVESLSRTTLDASYHCGQLAKNLLSLECCRIKTVSRTARINELHNLMDAIEKR